ncbi:hypothetical protein E2C01_031968 [Portunus trituberculatus]|uniref:Uncharacterized protein n=1 Tax=Portunus trituberculatus TaxID=210409 RepID=A0A5B7EUU4_PORTR|nr:hypothetical protein [Portunus trituberculatus]
MKNRPNPVKLQGSPVYNQIISKPLELFAGNELSIYNPNLLDLANSMEEERAIRNLLALLVVLMNFVNKELLDGVSHLLHQDS